MIYLQSVRSGRVAETSLVAQSYKHMAPFYAIQLAKAVEKMGLQLDAVVSPPSNRSDAAVYRRAVVKQTGALDMTDGFSRKGKVRAAAASSMSEMIEEFEYKTLGRELEIKSLLIVDELAASGKTCAALLHQLRGAGLTTDCKIAVAVAAWLK